MSHHSLPLDAAAAADRDRAIAAVLQRKRARHPELGAPLTVAALAHVLARDKISFTRLPLWPGVLGECVAVGECIMIAVDATLPDADQLLVLLHEVAHAWLHNTRTPLGAALVHERRHRKPFGPLGPVERQMESEADYVAATLAGLSPPALRRRITAMAERGEARRQLKR